MNCPGRNSGDSRNGTYQRTLQTSLGPITIDVPRDRNGEYAPMAIPRYSRRTDLVASTVLKLYSAGMTDEEMRLAISSTCEARCSRSTISAITDAVAEDVRRFSSRPLPRRLFALFLDSAYVPLRRGAVQKEAVSIAMGVTDEGVPLVVSYSVTPAESAEAYAEFLEGFLARGLERVEVAVADGIPGVDEAVLRSFPGVRRQRCFARLMRNVCSRVRSGDRAQVAADFMEVARRDGPEEGRAALEAFVAKWRPRYPRLAVWSERAEHVPASCEFPPGFRRLVHANNRAGSSDRRLRRMPRKQIQFVTEEALEKRVVSMFLHHDEAVGRRRVRCWREIVDCYEAR